MVFLIISSICRHSCTVLSCCLVFPFCVDDKLSFYFSCLDWDDGYCGCVNNVEPLYFAIFSITIMDAIQVDY